MTFVPGHQELTPEGFTMRSLKMIVLITKERNPNQFRPAKLTHLPVPGVVWGDQPNVPSRVSVPVPPPKKKRVQKCLTELL